MPVLTVQSETDVTLLGGGRARQEDTGLFRLWEMAGAAHFDTYGLNAAFQDDGSKSAADLQGMVSAPSGFQAAGDAPFNSGWQQHYVMQAAAAALEAWARHGGTPPSLPRLEAVDDEATDLRRDELGIAVGGLRTPWVDAPVACLSGQRQQSDGFPFGFLFGETHPFSADQLTGFTRADGRSTSNGSARQPGRQWKAACSLRPTGTRSRRSPSERGSRGCPKVRTVRQGRAVTAAGGTTRPFGMESFFRPERTRLT